MVSSQSPASMRSLSGPAQAAGLRPTRSDGRGGSGAAPPNRRPSKSVIGLPSTSVPPLIISASSFQVIDGQGRKRATFGLTDKDQPFLNLEASDNSSHVLISTRPEGPPFIILNNVKTFGGLSLYGPGGDWAAGIHLTSDTKHLGELFVSKDGIPSLILRDKEGKTLWKAP